MRHGYRRYLDRVRAQRRGRQGLTPCNLSDLFRLPARGADNGTPIFGLLGRGLDPNEFIEGSRIIWMDFVMRDGSTLLDNLSDLSVGFIFSSGSNIDRKRLSIDILNICAVTPWSPCVLPV